MRSIRCDRCGTLWTEGEFSRYPFLRFEVSPPLHPHQENTLEEVLDSGRLLSGCPKDPIPELDAAMRRGSDRRTAGDTGDVPPPSDPAPSHGAD